MKNIEKYKEDLDRLISLGDTLTLAMRHECFPEEFKEEVKSSGKSPKEIHEVYQKLPSFSNKYQNWYSESLVVTKLLLPDRVNDFIRLYEKPKIRKSIDNSNYVIEDYLRGLSSRNNLGEIIFGPSAAISQFYQQLSILKSAKKRFESSLFDIKQLIQADLFDSELGAAEELNKKGYMRGAGAVAGVVLESHLSQICENHNIKITKGNPTISDLNDLLKKDGIIEVPDWRFVQHLGDIRNKCDHKKKADPTQQEIEDLIEGVEKIIKSIF